MVISHFFNKSIVVRRLSTVSGYKKNFTSTGTVDVHIQKITQEDDMAIYGVYGATHKAWCDVSSDIQSGDRVTDGDGRIFDVVAIEKHDYGQAVQHLEVIMKLWTD
jgi:hypothetical protein